MPLISSIGIAGPNALVASFEWVDWGVVAGYFVLLAVTGYWLSRRKQESTDDYFLAKHAMPTWAVVFSIVATALSAATFIGVPALGYRSNLTYLGAFLGVLIAVVVVAWVFIPAFYRQRVTTVYELLEARYGLASKAAASVMFMIGRVFASGSRIFIAAIAIAHVVFPGEDQVYGLIAAIVSMAAVGILYTLFGGIRSVIWSDVIQLIVFVTAAGAAMIILVGRIPEPVGEIAAVLSDAELDDGTSKLTLFDARMNMEGAFALISVVTAWAIFNVAAYGTDQDMVQRMLTCRDSKRGSASVIASVLLNIPITALFLLVGSLLFVYYSMPDVMKDAAPAKGPKEAKDVFVFFILNEMPVGVKGLAIAGVFAAGLSSLNSALNAMSSAFVTDCYRHVRKGKSERHYLLVSRFAVVVWGCVLGGFAVICVFWQRASGMGLVNFALGVMTFAYAGLLAVFVAALFTRRGNNRSVIAALIVGLAVVALLRFQPFVPKAYELNLAWTWQFLIATVVAFLVCVVPTSWRMESETEGKSG